MRDCVKQNKPGSVGSFILQTLNVHLVQGCSFICQQCQGGGQKPFNGAGKRRLPVETIVTAVREAQPLGLRSIHLSGGDACVHPDFDRLLDWFENLELRLVIETNGNGFTPQRAARLARLPGARVMVGPSLDRPADDCTALDLALQSARLLSQAGLRPQMVFGVRRSNIRNIKDIIKLAEEAGAGSLRFINPRPEQLQRNSHQPVQPETLSVEEQIALGWRIERKLAQTTPLRLLYDQPPAFSGLRPPDPIAGHGRCSLQSNLALLSTGEYALCGLAEQVRALTFGEVGVRPLERIWREHPVLQDLRAGLPERLQGVCDRCVMKTACRGNCPADNFVRGGTFYTPYWFCETAERIGLFPASRLIENSW